MLAENMAQAAAKFPVPILTVYVNTSEMDATRHSQRQTGLTWILENAAALKRKLPHAEGKRCDQQARKVVRFLEKRHPAERSLVIFAGASTWQAIPLQEQVVNECLGEIHRLLLCSPSFVPIADTSRQ